MTVTLDQLLGGIKAQETGGEKNPYTTVNSIGALGAYQVMPSNLAAWSTEALGHAITKAEFLASPSDQDAIAKHIIGAYYDKYGAAGAAAMWYSGQPDPTKTFGNPSVKEYVADVLAKAGGQGPGASPGNVASASQSEGGGLFSFPKDITDFFSQGTSDLAALGSWFGAFTRPSTWVRIGSGVGGFIFLLFGIYLLGKSTKDV